jgi:hypothetical protein
MPRSKPLTEDQRLRYNAARRRKWADQMRHDPIRHARKVAQRIAWNHAKMKRCLDYKKLTAMRGRISFLRESITFHRTEVEKRERELLMLIRKVNVLAEKCRGK